MRFGCGLFKMHRKHVNGSSIFSTNFPKKSNFRQTCMFVWWCTRRTWNIFYSQTTMFYISKSETDRANKDLRYNPFQVSWWNKWNSINKEPKYREESCLDENEVKCSKDKSVASNCIFRLCVISKSSASLVCRCILRIS